jgi:signal transduction histidine kinase
MLRDSLATAAREAAARNIAVTIELPDTLPPLRADPDRLHSLVELLLFAAIKLARGDQLRVAAAGDGAHVAITLAGTGLDRHPIPAGADTLTGTGFPITTGAALRLAIAHRIAHGVGGSLGTTGAGDDAAIVLRLPAAHT